jgi:hypothetical protein
MVRCLVISAWLASVAASTGYVAISAVALFGRQRAYTRH